MPDIKCDNQYCKNGYVFVGNVNQRGNIICAQRMVRDINNNCQVDEGDREVLRVAFHEDIIGTSGVLGLNLDKFFDYVSHLNAGEQAAKAHQFQRAREESVIAEVAGKEAGIEPYWIEYGIRYLISLNMPTKTNNKECDEYCSMSDGQYFLYKLLGYETLSCACD